MLPRGPAVLALGVLAACSSEPEPVKNPATVREFARGVLVLEQAYEVSAADAWKAADSALEGGEFTVERRRRDECGGKIVARREDGHRVAVTIHAPERSAAEITLVVDPGDRDLLDTIQKRIAEKLGLKKASSALLGDTVLEASYEVDLDSAVGAAQRAFRALSLEVELLHRDRERARLEARDPEGRRLRLALHRTDGDFPATEVVLSAKETGGAEKELLRRVRRELERHLFPSSD
jgi:hypothetical protein